MPYIRWEVRRTLLIVHKCFCIDMKEPPLRAILALYSVASPLCPAAWLSPFTCVAFKAHKLFTQTSDLRTWVRWYSLGIKSTSGTSRAIC